LRFDAQALPEEPVAWRSWRALMMNGATKLGAGVGVWLIMAAGPALAATTAPVKPPQAPVRYSVPAGTVVEVALSRAITTRRAKTGDSFPLHLAAPLIVNGQIVLRAGTPGVGEVIESARPGLGGKGAKLVLDARYLIVHRRHIVIDGLKLAAAGHDNSTAAQVVGLGGIGFAPLGFVGLAIPGGDVTFPENTKAQASIVANVSLRSLGRASRKAILAAAQTTATPEVSEIPIPPPPAGEGQVVFFRAKSLMGTGQWFNVREDGKPLGKLVNGAYFVQVATPGLHTYTAVEEPEFKDRLTLKVDPGQTYFVEGALTKALVISAADLKPSTLARFDKVSKTLQPAPKAEETPQPDGGASPAAATPATPATSATSAGASTAPSLNN
jgi:hypothetical protein